MEVLIQGTEYVKTRHTSAQPGPCTMIRSPKARHTGFCK